MHGQKGKPRAPGELEFHLPGERENVGSKHDETWRQQRAQQLAKRHQQ